MRHKVKIIGVGNSQHIQGEGFVQNVVDKVKQGVKYLKKKKFVTRLQDAVGKNNLDYGIQQIPIIGSQLKQAKDYAITQGLGMKRKPGRPIKLK